MQKPDAIEITAAEVREGMRIWSPFIHPDSRSSDPCNAIYGAHMVEAVCPEDGSDRILIVTEGTEPAEWLALAPDAPIAVHPCSRWRSIHDIRDFRFPVCDGDPNEWIIAAW